MVAMALDIGEKRIGIAVSDASGRIASPVKVLPAPEVLSGARSFRYLVEDYDPEVLVFGRPMTLSGERGPQAERIEKQALAIGRMLGLPVAFEDERLSSAEAKRILREQGLNEKSMRGKVDMVAASIFLQTWLDAQRSQASAEG